MARLRTIREAGYSVTYAEVDRDAMGIAVPIKDPAGDVAAGLSIVALQSRLSNERREHAVRDLWSASDRIARKLLAAMP